MVHAPQQEPGNMTGRLVGIVGRNGTPIDQLLFKDGDGRKWTWQMVAIPLVLLKIGRSFEVTNRSSEIPRRVGHGAWRRIDHGWFVRHGAWMGHGACIANWKTHKCNNGVGTGQRGASKGLSMGDGIAAISTFGLALGPTETTTLSLPSSVGMAQPKRDNVATTRRMRWTASWW